MKRRNIQGGVAKAGRGILLVLGAEERSAVQGVAVL